MANKVFQEIGFIVNMYVDGCGRETVIYVYNKIFKTESGKKIYASMSRL